MVQPNAVLQNRYLILKPIGQGGMGAVYQAQDRRLNTPVALKETLFQDDVLLKAFHREAHLLASLKHPALTKVIDYFTEGQGQFLVMEFIPGDDLETRLQQQGAPFTVCEVLGWADQLLDALDYLHTQRLPIIHRDIKPQNLKLSDRGQIILLDFGLAKGSSNGTFRPVSDVSMHGYTPTYAPLEQIQRAGTDARSDLYSLAATVYHLITGVTPPDALARAGAVLNGKPDPLLPADQVNPQVPPSVAAVLTRAMALNREQRPASAAAMRKALCAAMRFCEATTDSLRAVAAQAVVAGPATLPNTQALCSPQPPERRDAQPVEKSKWMVYVAGVLAVLLIVGMAFALLKNSNRQALHATAPVVRADGQNDAGAEPEKKEEENPASNGITLPERETPAASRNESRAQDAPAGQPARQPQKAVRKARAKAKPKLPPKYSAY